MKLPLKKSRLSQKSAKTAGSLLKSDAEITPKSRLAKIIETIFGFRHRYTRKQFYHFVILFVVILYFSGLIVVMIIAYYPMKSGRTRLVQITVNDKFMGLAVNIYPLPAAVVNDEVISLREFYKQVSYLKHFEIHAAKSQSRSFSKEVADEAILHRRVLDNLIDTRLIRRGAKAENIFVTDADVDSAYQKLAEEYKQFEPNKSIEKTLRELFDMSVPEYKILISNQVLNEKIRKNLLVQVRISHIVTTDKTRLKIVQNALKKGDKFADVAKKYSQDINTQKQGGDLNWLSLQDIRDQISPQFLGVVLKLKVGQISAPVKTKLGYHIINLTAKRGKIELAFDVWLAELRKNAKIHRFIHA